MSNSFIIYGISVKKEFIQEHIKKLQHKRMNTDIKILYGSNSYIVGIKPKEIKSFEDGELCQVHEFDLAKTDFKQIEKRVLGFFREEDIPTDFFEFKLYTGLQSEKGIVLPSP